MADVVPNRIPQHVIQRLRLRDVSALAPDNSDEFAFPVEALALLCLWVDGDRIGWSGEGGEGFVEEDWEFGEGHVGLAGVFLVVETETADGLDVGAGEGSQEVRDVEDLVGDGVGAEDGTVDYFGLAGEGEVGCAVGEDGVAVVGAAVFGEEADETLEEG